MPAEETLSRLQPPFSSYPHSQKVHHDDIIIIMEQVTTLVCKLQPTDEQVQHLDDTLTRFAEACAYVQTTLPANIRNKDRMQALIYYDVRSRFQLSANLAI
jgi:predicted transposase